MVRTTEYTTRNVRERYSRLGIALGIAVPIVLALAGCGGSPLSLYSPLKETEVVPLLIQQSAPGEVVVEFPMCKGAIGVEFAVFGGPESAPNAEIVHYEPGVVATSRKVIAVVTSENLANGSLTNDLPVDAERAVPYPGSTNVPDDVIGVSAKVGDAWREFWFMDIDWSTGERWLVSLDSHGKRSITALPAQAQVDLLKWCEIA